MTEEGSRYDALIESIFFDHYRKGENEFEFARTELESAAESLGIDLPKNLGDVIYSYRFRKDLPNSVIATQFEGMPCRAIAAQFMDDEIVALCELTEQRGEVKVVEERHYRLVPANQLDAEAIRDYS